MASSFILIRAGAVADGVMRWLREIQKRTLPAARECIGARLLTFFDSLQNCFRVASRTDMRSLLETVKLRHLAVVCGRKYEGEAGSALLGYACRRPGKTNHFTIRTFDASAPLNVCTSWMPTCRLFFFLDKFFGSISPVHPKGSLQIGLQHLPGPRPQIAVSLAMYTFP